jgi:ATP-dependent DNA ligase
MTIARGLLGTGGSTKGRPASHRMLFYLFDVMHLDGFDLRAAPLLERKRVLAGYWKRCRHRSSIRSTWN